MKSKKLLIDRKSRFTYSILNFIDAISVGSHFKELKINGLERLPAGSFILVANHSSRWDGPVVQRVIKRPANYMVSPNELFGLQGLLLRAIGAFPADPRADLLGFMRMQASKCEPIVIFPEGDIYRDGGTHSFKNGAARIALLCMNAGLKVPVVPMAIEYSKTKPECVRVLVGDPIELDDRVESYKRDQPGTLSSITQQLHREVCHLRATLGSRHDRDVVFGGKPVRNWSHGATCR